MVASVTRRAKRKADAAAQTASGAGLLISCIPMVAMLPGAVGGALGLVGLGASSVVVSRLAPALNVIAQPLLLLSAVLLVVGGLRCSRGIVALALIGGVLLYGSMYVWIDSAGTTSPGPFYVGLGCFVGAYFLSWRRRRAKRCRPLVSQSLANRLFTATVVIGIIAIAAYANLAGTSGSAMPMTIH